MNGSSIPADSKKNEFLDKITCHETARRERTINRTGNLVNRGKLSLAEGDYGKALRLFSAAIKEDGGDWEAPFESGKVNYLNGEYAAAERQLKKSINLNPDNANAISLLLKIYRSRGRINEAVELLHITARKKANIDLMEEKAAVYLAAGLINEAERTLKRGLELEPDNGRLIARLGETYELCGEDDKALETYLLAKRCGAEKNDTRVRLGRIYLHRKEYEKAEVELTKAYAAGKDDPLILSYLGDLFLATARYELAAEFLCRAVELDKKNGKLRLALGKALEKTGNCRAALREYKNAGKLGESSETVLKFSAAAHFHNVSARLAGKNVYSPVLNEELHSRAVKAAKNINLTSHSFEKFMKLGILLRDVQEIEPAADMFEKARLWGKRREDPAKINAALNELEITRKDKVLKSQPRELRLTLTGKCNLECIMCNSKSNWEISHACCDEIKSMLPRLETVFWGAGAGEVFMYKGFKELLGKSLKYREINHIVNTNGLLIDKAAAELLSALKAKIIFSIDGSKEGTYENIRKGASFRKLAENIELVNRFKKKVNSCVKQDERRMLTDINFVVMKSNFMEMEAIFDFMCANGFDGITYSAVDNILGTENLFLNGRAAAIARIRKSAANIIKKSLKLKKIVTFRFPRFDLGEKSKTTKSTNKGSCSDYMFCYRPWKSVFVSGEGELRPHCFCNNPAGNLMSGTIEDCWNGTGMRSYREHISRGSYTMCDYKCIAGMAENEHG